MPTFIPLTRLHPLPIVDQAIECPVLDCKREPAKSQYEMAKDVAAFANHLGGTLLLGAVESDEILRKYCGMTPKNAGKAIKDYSAAVADRCWPRPAIDPVCFDDPSDPTKKVIAINVQPSLDLVSVKFPVEKSKEDYGGDAYVFPVRSGNHTRYLEPGQLAMFMTPQIRRIAVMLARIPHDAEVLICPDSKSYMDCKFVDISEEDNICTVITNINKTVRYPLDMIQSVFQNIDGKWHIMTNYYK